MPRPEIVSNVLYDQCVDDLQERYPGVYNGYYGWKTGESSLELETTLFMEIGHSTA